MTMTETSESKQPALILTEAEKPLWTHVYAAMLAANYQSEGVGASVPWSEYVTYAQTEADAAIMAIRARSAPKAIDALPDKPATARVPDTATPLQKGDEVRVIGETIGCDSRHIGKTGVYEGFDAAEATSTVRIEGNAYDFPRASLDGPLNRPAVHIVGSDQKAAYTAGLEAARDTICKTILEGHFLSEESLEKKFANQVVAMIKRIQWDNPRQAMVAVAPTTQPAAPNHIPDAGEKALGNITTDAQADAFVAKLDGEKVTLPGKWTARDPEKDAIHFGGIIPRPGASIGVAINSEEAQDIIEAANKLRELTFDAAFRAGVEAAAACLPDNSVNPELVRKMLAIQPPKID